MKNARTEDYENQEKKEVRKIKKLNKVKERYKSHEKFIIARTTRKTIRYIEKHTENFPNNYFALKNKIVNACYDILEYVYRANVFQTIDDKKEIIVQIQLLNFYLEEALQKDLLTPKKFNSYTNHLIEIDKMTRMWLKYEEIK